MAEGPESSAESPYDLAPRPAEAPSRKPGAAQPSPPDAGGEIPLVEPAAPQRAPATPLAEPQAPGRPCPHCGFLIRGKTTRNRCPDCSGPLDQSVAGMLQFAQKGWTRGLAWGALLLVPAIACEVAAIIVHWQEVTPLDRWLHLAGPLLALIGTWLVTRREPRDGEKSPWAWPARIAALLVLALWLPITLHPADREIGRHFLYAILPATGVMAFLLGFHLRGLAVRIPSDSLAAQAQNLAWIIGGLCLFLGGLELFDLARPEYLTLFMCAFPLIGILAGLLGWAAAFALLMGLQLFGAAAAADGIAARHAARIAKATGPANPRRP